MVIVIVIAVMGLIALIYSALLYKPCADLSAVGFVIGSCFEDVHPG